jgi:hypothetical protein
LPTSLLPEDVSADATAAGIGAAALLAGRRLRAGARFAVALRLAPPRFALERFAAVRRPPFFAAAFFFFDAPRLAPAAFRFPAEAFDFFFDLRAAIESPLGSGSPFNHSCAHDETVATRLRALLHQLQQ